MEFRETLLAAQRNQQQKSSDRSFYKAKFDPPKKEQKTKDRLSANIQKFLAKKEEEETQKKIEAQRKRDELLAMRDPKALRKIQKTLKVIKSANKSVLEDAVDREHTAITREGPSQPDQDDYGYESQEAAAIYQKMMEKYSKIPDEPKFPTNNIKSKKDLEGTKERVKQALLQEDEPVPHKRRRRTGTGDGSVIDRSPSPPSKTEQEKKRDEKPKFRKPAPPPMDFNQLLKLAEQKKSEPLEAAAKKVSSEPEPERLMTKKQKREYEEEMARRMRRQERIDAEKSGHKVSAPKESPQEKERKPESVGFGRIPKIGDKGNNIRVDNTKPNRIESPNINKYGSPKPSSYSKQVEKDKITIDKDRRDKEKIRLNRERIDKERADRDRVDRERLDKDKIDRERLDKDKIDRDRDRIDREKLDKDKIDRERLDRDKIDRDRANRDRVDKDKLNRDKIDKDRLDRLKAERERIERDIERLNRDRERLEKTKMKLESISKVNKKPVESTKMREQEYKKNIDLKSQNTYRIDKQNDKKIVSKNVNGNSSQGKVVPKERLLQKQNDQRLNEQRLNGVNKIDQSKILKDRLLEKRPAGDKVAPGKPKLGNTFDFDKHVNSLKNGKKPDGAKQFPPGDVKRKMRPEDIKRKQMMKRRVVDSESEYDSEMDDFIDDGDVGTDYSSHIKEIFGYDRTRYRDMDDDDDPSMESSFSRQMHEEYVSKKIGIMEDLEDMRLEKQMKKKKRRISDD